jgi:single-stranded-DNA-specific exonuclease
MKIIRRRNAPGSANLPSALHPVVRRVYAGRGVQQARELDLSLEHLLPVSSLGGIAAAVDLLIHHRDHRIVVVGDFDADGATSTALVVRQLRRLGFADVQFVVPNRFQFGYGLTPQIVRLVAQREPQLIVTVDNGMSSHAGVSEARGLGIDVLVTDHHLPGSTSPPAAAIVNPNAHGERFASKALAGVGVAFYVMAALTREMQMRDLAPKPAPVAELLDLVALGTIADLVPLDYNNRILVHQGLRRIRAGRCVPGIRALIEASDRSLSQVVAADLGFQIGPRLNAAGRLDDMTIGIQCLLTDDLTEARMLAGRLTQLNRDRRELEQRMQREALATLADMRAEDPSLPLGLCLFDETWHQGVVGLVASRVKDRVHRPVIAMARGDGEILKGSARSVPGVHIRDVLDAIAAREPDLIDKFGGHAMAAGLSIRADRLERFRVAFDQEVRRWLAPDAIAGVLESDGELSADELCLETAHALRAAGPWGQAFPEPLFDGHFLVREMRVLADRHLKMKLSLPNGPICEAIAFGHFDDEEACLVHPEQTVHLAYRADVNQYDGTERLQLIVEHLAPCSN